MTNRVAQCIHVFIINTLLRLWHKTYVTRMVASTGLNKKQHLIIILDTTELVCDAKKIREIREIREIC